MSEIQSIGKPAGPQQNEITGQNVENVLKNTLKNKIISVGKILAFKV